MELLERESQLAALTNAWAKAAGAGRVALVSGEAGSGKTSLVERFVREHQDSSRVLSIREPVIPAPTPAEEPHGRCPLARRRTAASDTKACARGSARRRLTYG